ncbi:MAG TPA: PhzF family phenazine biosynthesis protein [Actinomycetes bacterium]|nr:PhzF family phenazine biosynthesis protein [Actinomycetes bacterium]
MSWPLYQVDAFTDEPFAGNPAAVCLLAADADPAWMQRVAAEMNLPETAFLRPSAEAGRYGLRWFTPTVEVELCGHATLASAHVLFSEGLAEAGRPVRFDSASGPLTARPGAGGAIWLDFPATPAAPADPPGGLLEALGAGPVRWVGLGRLDYLVELEDEAAVRDLAPDVGRLGWLGSRGVIVTAAASGTGAYDFVSRFFAPGAGIDEDPVTGSAHCALGPFWAGRLGRDELTGFQASARGGLVQVCPEGDRVLLGGRAVTVLRGQLV